MNMTCLLLSCLSAHSYGQAAVFTCHPCLPRTTAAVLYGIAFIAALLLVRLLTWLTVTDNNASAAAAVAAAAAAAGPSHGGKAAATAAGQQVATRAKNSGVGPTTQQSRSDQRVGHKQLSFLGCFGSNSGDDTGGDIALDVEDTASEAQPPSPSAVRPAMAKGLPPSKSGTSVQGIGLLPSKSSASVQSATAGVAQSIASSVSPTGGGTGASYLARASDIFRVLVLYIQVRVGCVTVQNNCPHAMVGQPCCCGSDLRPCQEHFSAFLCMYVTWRLDTKMTPYPYIGRCCLLSLMHGATCLCTRQLGMA
jgi:hypothetical protein